MLYGFSMEFFWTILLATLGIIIAGYCIGILAWYTNTRSKSTSEDVQDVSPKRWHRTHKAA